ncbi:MAG TPA: YjcZ family sporulation protein [Bacillales bacterium]
MSYGFNNGFVLLVVLFVLLVIVGSNYPMGNYGW